MDESAESEETLETAESDFQTYDETASNIPVTAQYPDTMEVTSTGSSEGVGVFFTFLPQGTGLDDAEIHVFFPASTSTVEEIEPFVTGPNGLIESNGWYLDSIQAGNTDRYPYPWVKDFSTDFEQSGNILLGHVDDQAVRVTVLYPAEMADAFWPDAEVVLDSLEFEEELLPVSISEGL